MARARGAAVLRKVTQAGAVGHNTGEAGVDNAAAGGRMALVY